MPLRSQKASSNQTLLKIEKTIASLKVLSSPICITGFIAIFLSTPYLIFFDNSQLLLERIFSCLAFAFLIVCPLVIFGKRIWLICIFCLLTLVYCFVANYEIGNYLVKGDTFSAEFWQFMEGLTKNSIILPFQAAPFLTSAGILGPFISVFFIYQMLKSMNFQEKRSNRKYAFVFCLILFFGSGFVVFKHSSACSMAISYVAFSSMKEKVRQASYVRKIPARGEVTAKKGKNILHIILESFGDIYTDSERFPGLTPNLARYKKEGISAANMVQTPNQANSYMGHFVIEHGRYYFIPPDSKEFEVGLGFILKKAGYKNIFIRGAGANMAGPFSILYSPQNGYDSFFASDFLKKKYDKKSISGFGFSDEILFKEALHQYKQLIKDDQPFKLTLFTLDMHGFPQGISKICKEKYTYSGRYDYDELVQGAHCTDTLVNLFLSEIAKLPKFDDLLIVIHSDHVQHNVTPAVVPDSQRLYAVILGAETKIFQQKQLTHLMDIPPTILSQAAVETNAKFFAGDDFSRELKREAILNRDLELNNFSNKMTNEMVTVIDFTSLNDVFNENTIEYEDSSLKISYAGFEGAIFSTYYFYFQNKQEHIPFYVLYPIEESLPKIFRPRRGILLDKHGASSYAIGIKKGKISKWCNVLLEDLVTGHRWKIGLNDKRIFKLTLNNKRRAKPLAKEKVFQLKDREQITKLRRVTLKSDNVFKVNGYDSQVFFEMDLSRKRPHIVEIEMISEHKDIAKLYYEINDTSFSELNVSSAILKPGKNTFSLYLPQGVYGKRFRFDLGEKKGVYAITFFNVYSLKSG